MEKQQSKQSSLDLQVTDAGYLTRSASSVAGSKRKRVNDFALARMYQDKNFRVSQVCAALGISTATMYDRLHKMGIPTRQKPSPKGKRLTRQMIHKIHGMHLIGHTKYQIAKTLGVSSATVSRHLSKGIMPELYVPPTKIEIQAHVVSPTPSLWSRIKSWFN